MIYADSSRLNTGRAHSPINSLASSRPILNVSFGGVEKERAGDPQSNQTYNFVLDRVVRWNLDNVVITI